MKHLPPTLREDKRYLKIRINSADEIDFSNSVNLINDCVKDFAGEKGLAEISPWIIKRKFDFEKQVVVVRINRDFENLFRSALIFSEAQLVTLKASGTLKDL